MICPDCNGSGSESCVCGYCGDEHDGYDCETCKGSGKVDDE